MIHGEADEICRYCGCKVSHYIQLDKEFVIDFECGSGITGERIWGRESFEYNQICKIGDRDNKLKQILDSISECSKSF